MAKYNLKVTVTEIRGGGYCELGLAVGDTFMLKDDSADFCVWAHASMLPYITVMRYGGRLPWEPDPEVAWIGCPDPRNTVVFRLERVEEVEE